MIEIGRHLKLDGRERCRMEERVAEIHCRLVVDGECGETLEVRDGEEELLDELAQLEAALRTEELGMRNITEKERTL